MTTKRKAISERLKVQSILHRAWLQGHPIICAGCKLPIMPADAIEFDHIHAVTAIGPHEYGNLRPMHEACHTAKSAVDVALNAKAKRLAKGGRKRKGPPMKSKPFPKKPKGYKYRWKRTPITATRGKDRG